MSNIGSIRKNQNNNNFSGQINTLDKSFSFSMKENLNKGSDFAPDYNIFAVNGSSEPPSIGAVWKKVSTKNGDRTEFLSITFDDPSFDKPLNVAAFPNDEGGWDIIWRRRQDKVPVAA